MRHVSTASTIRRAKSWRIAFSNSAARDAGPASAATIVQVILGLQEHASRHNPSESGGVATWVAAHNPSRPTSTLYKKAVRRKQTTLQMNRGGRQRNFQRGDSVFSKNFRPDDQWLQSVLMV